MRSSSAVPGFTRQPPRAQAAAPFCLYGGRHARRHRRRFVAVASLTGTLVIGACAGRVPPPLSAPPVIDARDPHVRTLQGDLARILDTPAMGQGVLAVSIRSLSRDDVLFRYHARTLMVPASTMKLVTLAAAAERLGWDFSYDTTVTGTAPIDAGVLRGDLVVVGSGDPTLSGPDGAAARMLDDWANALWQRGLRRVDGRVVGDDRAFQNEPMGAGWAWDDLAYGYAAPVGALQINENAADVVITPGAAVGDRASILVDPAESGLVAIGHVTTTAAGTASALQMSRAAGSPVIGLTGTVPAGAPVHETIAVANPTLYVARMLVSALRRRGIEVRDGAADLDDLPGMAPFSTSAPLLVRRSSPLRELAVPMIKRSLNVDAEALLRAVARQSGGIGSIEAGRAAVAETLGRWGIDANAIVQADGSGLSRFNLVTADALVEILRRMYVDVHHQAAWLGALPVAGVDGTLVRRFKGTRAEGVLRAKTGTLTNVRALAGYVPSANGEWLAFAILVNNVAADRTHIDGPIDQAVTRLAAFTR
jgi:serine-type D-Ala-D-Ala carboxypeptidase/endopeptidase (penicillin-binding protein 4)